MEMTVVEIDKRNIPKLKKNCAKSEITSKLRKYNDNDTVFPIVDAPTFRHRFRSITVSP